MRFLPPFFRPKRFELYLLHHMLTSGLLVLGVVCMAVWLGYSLRFIEMVAFKAGSLRTFGLLSLYVLPQLMLLILPIAFVFSLIYTYFKLEMDNEIISLRSLGLSYDQLARPALWCAGVITVALYCLSLFIVPASFRALKDLEHQLRQSFPISLVQEGAFTTFGDFTIYVRERQSHGSLLGIVAHIRKNEEQTETLTAQKGQLLFDTLHPTLVLYQGARQEYNPKTRKLQTLQFEETLVEIPVPDVLAKRERKPYEMTLKDLAPPGPKGLQNLKDPQISREIWQRLIAPLSPFLFALVITPMLLVRPFIRRQPVKPILWIVTWALLLEVLLSLLNHVAIRAPWLLPLGYGFLFLGASLFFNRRIMRA